MDIQFYYKNTKPKREYEVIITSFSIAVSQVIALPDSLEVCLYPLPDNVYGGIDNIKTNRIGINYNIPIMSLPKILTHELIHVNQKHTGILKINRDGLCYWHGIPYTKSIPENMSYSDYQNLPWELDVANKQQKIFHDALTIIDSGSKL